MILPKRRWLHLYCIGLILLIRSIQDHGNQLPLSQMPEHYFVMETILPWNLQEKQDKNSKNSKTNKQQTKKKQENILYHLPQLVSAELLKDNGDSVFHTRKPTHSLYINTKLTFDALKTELPAPQLQIKAMPNFPHQASSILTTSLIFSECTCVLHRVTVLEPRGQLWTSVSF